MKYMFFAAAVFALGAPLSAFAETERVTGAEYLAASRCVALATLRELQGEGYNVDTLNRAVRRYNEPRANAIADSEKDRIRLDGVHARGDEAALAQLRERRDASCAPFLASGLVQRESASAAS